MSDSPQYSFQLAFTNPLYDPIQIRLHPSSATDPSSSAAVHIGTPHFTVDPLKDAWAYEDDLDEPEVGGSEDTSTSGRRPRSSLASNTGARSVQALLGSSSKRKREGDVEKQGNITKIGLVVEVLPNATGSVEVCFTLWSKLTGADSVQFDLEVRLTYRVEDDGGAAGVDAKAKKETYKSFTFWVRVDLGLVE